MGKTARPYYRVSRFFGQRRQPFPEIRASQIQWLLRALAPSSPNHGNKKINVMKSPVILTLAAIVAALATTACTKNNQSRTARNSDTSSSYSSSPTSTTSSSPSSSTASSGTTSGTSGSSSADLSSSGTGSSTATTGTGGSTNASGSASTGAYDASSTTTASNDASRSASSDLAAVNPNPPVSAVQHAITSDQSLSSAAQNIQVTAEGRKIILTGVVQSRDLKNQIEKKAKSAASGWNVDNKITVQK
jgi:hypothetical protein